MAPAAPSQHHTLRQNFADRAARPGPREADQPMRTPRRVVLAQACGGVRATPAYRSAQAAGPVAEVERHSVSGTTPGGTRGRPLNRAVTSAWLRGMTPPGTAVL